MPPSPPLLGSWNGVLWRGFQSSRSLPPGGCGNPGQRRIILPVISAHLVDHQIERRHHNQGKATGSGLPKGISGGTGDMPIGIVFEHQAVRAVRIEPRHLAALSNVVGWYQLSASPTSVLQQAIAKTQGIGSSHSDAARAIGMGQRDAPR